MPIPPLEPQVAFPKDEGLPDLDRLFDNHWVWHAFCIKLGEPEEAPKRIRVLWLDYQPGASAIACYAAEWEWGKWVVEDQFAIELVRGQSETFFHYPDDPHLPGLRLAASAVDAPELLAKHVALSPYRLRVESVRYRPGTRAVLRHISSWRQSRLGHVTLFVRVMRPRRVQRLLTSAVLAKESGFVIPRFVGSWEEGGVVWMTRIPGATVRTMIGKGIPPEPHRVLDGLEKLWSATIESKQGRPLNLLADYQWTAGLLSRSLQGDGACRILQQATDVLGPFSKAWRPSTLAHNDFYDDQMLVTPDGEIALVDFEETGPGDPLYDVGNMLAHMRWMAWFGNDAEARDAYRQRMRSAALDRFGWQPQDLAVRESHALFSLSVWPIHQLRGDWAKSVETGLELVIRALEEAN